MIGKELTKIEEKDLQDLIDNVVLEGKTIEYKAVLPGDTPDEKKEFLSDVSSFANAGGGDIIFGITEDRVTREPKSVDGVELATSVDQEKARLDNIMRDGIEPRMPAAHIHTVSLKNGKTAIVIRVGKSWVSPHRVTYKGHDKFYSRNSSGKYPLDVGDLRTAFTMSETITERVRRFREERIARLYANETPVPMDNVPKTALHMIPVDAFEPGKRYDIDKIAASPSAMRTIYGTGGDYRYTLEGFLNYTGGTNEFKLSYVHLYRTGIIESVEGALMRYEEDGKKVIYGVSIEERFIQVLDNYISVLESLEVSAPIFIFLSMVAAKGFGMPASYSWDDEGYPIDRDVLLLPEVVIHGYSVKAEQVLKPVFDALWNSCGYPCSKSYNDKGVWTGR